MRDLAYATALLDASERMQRQSDLTALLQLVVAEALTVIGADGAAIVRFTGIRRRVGDTYLGTGIEDQRLVGTVRAYAESGWLFRPGCVEDLSVDRRWTAEEAYGAPPPWRSLMTVSLRGPAQKDQFRLCWFSAVPRSFDGLTDVAELFGRHASMAIGRRGEAELGPTDPSPGCSS